MKWTEIIRLSLRAIRGNMLRAGLTLAIIAFGIMALVGILTAIDSAIYSLNDNFSGLGANSFSISPKGEEGVQGNRRGRQSKEGAPISYDQAIEFKERYNFPSTVMTSVNTTSMAVAKYQNEKTNPNVNVMGIDDDYLDVKKYELELGRNFTRQEVELGGHKAIIGMDIVDDLFDDKPEEAINKNIGVGNVKYRVIGVLESQGASMGQSNDRFIYIPLLTAKRYYGSSNQNYNLVVAVNQPDYIDDAAAAATGIFRNVRDLKIGQDNDFEITKSDNLIELLRENTVKFRIAAVAIGLITLLGAAIGLMNIMLVSVSERTREIGVCKAIGATNSNILNQFLTEAIIICQLGGLVGIVLGILIGNVVSQLMGGSFIVPWAWIGLGVFTCLVVGLLSGIYPALKAAQLDPIDSLRHE